MRSHKNSTVTYVPSINHKVSSKFNRVLLTNKAPTIQHAAAARNFIRHCSSTNTRPAHSSFFIIIILYLSHRRATSVVYGGFSKRAGHRGKQYRYTHPAVTAMQDSGLLFDGEDLADLTDVIMDVLPTCFRAPSTGVDLCVFFAGCRCMHSLQTSVVNAPGAQ